VDALCAEAKSKLRGSGAVLKCLVTRLEEAGDSCQVRGVRFAGVAVFGRGGGGVGLGVGIIVNQECFAQGCGG